MFKKYSTIIFFTLTTITLISCSATKNSATKKESTIIEKAPATLSENLQNLLQDYALQNAFVGVCLYDSASKNFIEEYNSNKMFVPASTTKLFTTYAALKYIDDSIVGAIISSDSNKNFKVIGTGDPTFLHPDFKNQIVHTALNNLSSFTLVNNSNDNFLPYSKGCSWEDYDATFMPEKTNFPIYGNTVRFNVSNKNIFVFPKLFNSSYFISSNTKLKREIGKNIFYIHKNKTQFEIPFTTQNNNCLTELLIDTFLNYKNIVEQTNFNEKNTASWVKIYSQPRDTVIKKILYNSNNFFAEQLLLNASFNRFGFNNDELLIDSILKKDLADLPQKPNWIDGSGLSRYNLQSPQNFVFLLNKLKDEFGYYKLQSLLPTSNEGTLKNFFINYKNKIFAKTGSMSNTFSLCGYLITNKNNKITFSIIVNNANLSSLQVVRLAVEKYLINVIENN